VYKTDFCSTERKKERKKEEQNTRKGEQKRVE
jgi:hypothetical protein